MTVHKEKPWLKFYDRTGIADSGAFTWDQVYTDYAYGVYGADLYIELSGAGISPNRYPMVSFIATPPGFPSPGNRSSWAKAQA